MSTVPSQRVVLARHASPHGEIQLQQRPLDDGTLAFEIIVDGVFLMASYNQTGERALAHSALEALFPHFGQRDLRILVGGLGMGFTLQEILLVDSVVAVDVVEISPYIIEWNQTHFVDLNGGALADPRVQLTQNDVCGVLESAAQYHAIVIDVDNGPSWMSQPANARLYTAEALQRWLARLVPGGCFGVWSAQREPEFLARLAGVFREVEEILVEASSRTEPAESFIYRAST